jgi:hypothetical protein
MDSATGSWIPSQQRGLAVPGVFRPSINRIYRMKMSVFPRRDYVARKIKRQF